MAGERFFSVRRLLIFGSVGDAAPVGSKISSLYCVNASILGCLR
jgi:hypothetical protein